jgi:hypothetical protein
MPNPIKYNTSAETLALKKGNFWIGTGDVGKGPTSSTGYYNGITPPTGGYTIYLNKESNGPSIYTASNDAQLISLTNSIAGQSYTTVSQCIQYFSLQTDKFVTDIDFGPTYPYIVMDGLTCYLDAGIASSYIGSGNNWIDISGNKVNVSRIGDPTWNSDGYWELNNNGESSLVITSPSANGFSFTNSKIPISGNNSFTLESFVRFNSLNNSQISIISNAFSSNGYRWGANNDGSMYWLVGSPNGVGYSEGGVGSGITTSTWVHIVGVFDKQNELGGGNKVYSYINSSLTGEVTVNANLNMGNITPGIIRNPCCKNLDGDLAIIRIYNKALTSSEITQNYDAQKSRFELT